MRIALFYNRDIYAHLALNLLTLRLSEHLLGFFYSEHVGTKVERDFRLQKLAEFEKSFDLICRDKAKFNIQYVSVEYYC